MEVLYHNRILRTRVDFSPSFLYNKRKMPEVTTMNEAMHNLLTRRSVRKYEDRQVPDDLLDAVLEAGLFAPSGMNTQNTVMVAVRDKETRDLLSKMNAAVMGSQADPFYGAPCVIVVLVDPERYTCVEDGSLVMGNLMEAAHALGLGSCWIHRAGQMFDTPEGKALLNDWGLPENLRGIGNCILGYAAEEPEAKPRREGRIVKVD
jgi:nitroreductase